MTTVYKERTLKLNKRMKKCRGRSKLVIPRYLYNLGEEPLGAALHIEGIISLSTAIFVEESHR